MMDNRNTLYRKAPESPPLATELNTELALDVKVK